MRGYIRSSCRQFRSELGVFRFFRDLGSGVLPAVLEAVAVAVHLQDVDVVGETVQQRPGQPFRPEDFGPFVEGQVGGDQDGAPLVALAETPRRAVSAPVGDRGTKPSSSMMSRLSRESCRCRLRRRLSSRASISSCTRAAAVVKPTDMAF